MSFILCLRRWWNESSSCFGRSQGLRHAIVSFFGVTFKGYISQCEKSVRLQELLESARAKRRGLLVDSLRLFLSIHSVTVRENYKRLYFFGTIQVTKTWLINITITTQAIFKPSFLCCTVYLTLSKLFSWRVPTQYFSPEKNKQTEHIRSIHPFASSFVVICQSKNLSEDSFFSDMMWRFLHRDKWGGVFFSFPGCWCFENQVFFRTFCWELDRWGGAPLKSLHWGYDFLDGLMWSIEVSTLFHFHRVLDLPLLEQCSS